MSDRQHIVALARSYLGTPFRHQARLKGIGIDCAGLLLCVGDELGLDLPPFTIYSKAADGVSFRLAMAERFDEITEAEAGPGDMVLFWVSERTRHPHHSCILSDLHGGLGMIHALAGASVIETSYTDEWRAAADSYWRYRI